MKKYFLLTLVVCLSGALTIFGCAGEKAEKEQPTEIVKEQYQCPMKCTEEIFEKPGTCKVCGMDLEKITKS